MRNLFHVFCEELLLIWLGEIVVQSNDEKFKIQIIMIIWVLLSEQILRIYNDVIWMNILNDDERIRWIQHGTWLCEWIKRMNSLSFNCIEIFYFDISPGKINPELAVRHKIDCSSSRADLQLGRTIISRCQRVSFEKLSSEKVVIDTKIVALCEQLHCRYLQS